MTMPNIEELIAVLEATNQFHDNADICTADVIAVLRSQAERIAELERESETHSKAYGLAIVERDNLRTEVEAVRKANLDCVDHYNAALAEINDLDQQLKVAQEGWRCECSTDDACRFARERDALRAQLAESVSNHEACKSANSMLLETIAEIEKQEPVGYAYANQDFIGSVIGAKGEWAPREIALFTRPMPAQDVTELVDAFEHHIEQTRPIERSTIALSKYKGAK